MALLNELGNEYPCQTEGYAVDVEDQAETMAPGDIVEAWFTTDEDIKYYKIASAMEELLKTKEQYPGFVIHYVRFETHKVVVQFSVAPPDQISGQGISTSITNVVGLVAICATIIAALLVGLAITVMAWERGWLFPYRPKTGAAYVIARNAENNDPIPDVTITTNSTALTTGPNGEGVLFEDLIVGEHIFVGSTVEGYQAPDPIAESVIENEQITVTIWYNPEGYTPPTHGTLNITSTPIYGEAVVDAEEYQEWFKLPQSLYLPAGEYNVFFSEERGYLTPAPQKKTVTGGQSVTAVGYYTTPPSRWYEKYIMYGLVGLGAIIGAAVLVPKAIEAIARRRST